MSLFNRLSDEGRIAMLQFNVPPLPDKRPYSLEFAARRLFLGGTPTEYKPYALVFNYIRLTDLACDEYESARRNLNIVLEGKEDFYSARLKASNHFEVCIDSLKKAICFLELIAAEPSLGEAFTNSYLFGEIKTQVVSMRNTMQHLDERIKKGQIQLGEPLCVFPKENGIDLGKHSILYNDLFEWLRQLRACSAELAKFS